jgi:hypothetical protein
LTQSLTKKKRKEMLYLSVPNASIVGATKPCSAAASLQRGNDLVLFLGGYRRSKPTQRRYLKRFASCEKAHLLN